MRCLFVIYGFKGRSPVVFVEKHIT